MCVTVVAKLAESVQKAKSVGKGTHSAILRYNAEIVYRPNLGYGGSAPTGSVRKKKAPRS